MLNFRGLSFYFPIDSKFQPGYAHGLGSLQFPNGTSPLVAKTAIYMGNMSSGSSSSDEHCLIVPAPPLPLVIYSFARNNFCNFFRNILYSILIFQACYHNNLYLEKAEILRDNHRTIGIKMNLFTESSSSSRVLLEPKKRNLTRVVSTFYKYFLTLTFYLTFFKRTYEYFENLF